MKLLFSNDSTIEIDIDNSQLGTTYQKIYKNLTHVPIPFSKWDNPYYLKTLSYIELVDQLILYANLVSVKVDRELCLQRNQQHFNDIHKIYEKNYDGHRAWLDFHEHIHLCEYYDRPCKFLSIDYREKAGPLEKKFDMTWMKNTTTKIKKGDIFVQWAELGKTPYSYWLNNEPTDIARMCELAKPWLKLRPKLLIATDNKDTLENVKVDEFTEWWKQYSKPWCDHWGLESWTIKDIYAANVFGNVPDIDRIIFNLKNNILPVRVLV
jgi:hypothetical protein